MSAVDPELLSPGLVAMAIPFNRLTLPFVRMGYRISSSPGPGVTQTTHHVEDGDVRVLVFAPTERSAPRPAVLWIHGGGMCVGTPRLEAELAGTTGRETSVRSWCRRTTDWPPRILFPQRSTTAWPR